MHSYLLYSIIERSIDTLFDSLEQTFGQLTSDYFKVGAYYHCISRRSSYQSSVNPYLTIYISTNFHGCRIVRVDKFSIAVVPEYVETVIAVVPEYVETVNMFPSPEDAFREYPRDAAGCNAIKDQNGTSRTESYQLYRSGSEVITKRIPMKADNPPYVIEIAGIYKAW